MQRSDAGWRTCARGPLPRAKDRADERPRQHLDRQRPRRAQGFRLQGPPLPHSAPPRECHQVTVKDKKGSLTKRTTKRKAT